MFFFKDIVDTEESKPEIQSKAPKDAAVTNGLDQESVNYESAL